MNWKTLQDRGKVEPHVTSKQELDDLRAAIRRNLGDASIAQLSSDNRFGIAYQVTLLTAKMALACAGYRVKGPGAHQTTFQALTIALGDSIRETAEYLDRCRRKQNDLTYDAEGIVSEVDAAELLTQAESLIRTVETWIVVNHPSLKP